jgi:hypothetical protein
VYRSVEWFAQWGLAQRQLQQVWSIGIDEIHWGQGKRGPVSHRDLSDRQSLPTTVMGGAATDAGHVAARLAGLGIGCSEGIASYV